MCRHDNYLRTPRGLTSSKLHTQTTKIANSRRFMRQPSKPVNSRQQIAAAAKTAVVRFIPFAAPDPGDGSLVGLQALYKVFTTHVPS